MKKVLLISALIVSFLLIYGCKKDDDNMPTEPGNGNGGSGSIGELTLSTDAILMNNSVEVIVRLEVPSNIALDDSSVTLSKVDAEGNPTSNLGPLYDNGNLGNGDEIVGDNVFSGIITFYESSAGTINLTAFSGEGENERASSSAELRVYTDLSSGEHKQIIKTQDDGVQKFEDELGGNVANAEQAIDNTVNWLSSQPGVQTVEKAGKTSISITYDSGLLGGIVFSYKDANGTVYTRGGLPAEKERSKTTLPIKQQTRGKNLLGKTHHQFYKSNDELDPEHIGNRNVLIYAPFEAAFAPYNERESIVQLLNSSDFEFEIESLVNQQADVSSLYNLPKYGFIIIATHGSQGKYFATGEIVDTNATNYDTYKTLRKAQKLSVWKSVTISDNGDVSEEADIYAVTDKFISGLTNKFPNSVILNNSCESTMNSDLSNAFIAKGAKTYYGYDKVVNSDFCVTNADTLVRRLAVGFKNTGDAFMAGSDPSDPYATYQLKGSQKMYFPFELINGDFEFGNINGWTVSGDGRVISKLAIQQPNAGSFMGIISTGLGYTTSTGVIFQSFRIGDEQTTLSFNWNFLSEEFLEYINSQYQDYFKVTVRTKDGNEQDLFHKTIDGIASDFGAQEFKGEEGEVPQPGNLVYVSPDIVFDQADVYMTGWQSASYDVSAYQGKIITLILGAGDVGDSVYDTAILLDNIKVE